jgi:hypothetical protein
MGMALAVAGLASTEAGAEEETEVETVENMRDGGEKRKKCTDHFPS